MLFQTPLIKGTLLKRYKRFLADVELCDGSVVIAHCPNTGAMTGCAEPGYQVWLSPSTDPKRKLKYTWELAQNHQGHWIGINTHRANQLVIEAIHAERIPELDGYKTLKKEVKYGSENSRIDILLSDDNKVDCYVEVKSVTLLLEDKGYFPDAKTTRGTKHIRELIEMVNQGKRAVLFFCTQHTGIEVVSAAQRIDPEYADTLRQAMQAGVEVLVYSAQINQKNVAINQRLEFIY
ncbi:DNA/RNA nuclease SfsA [Aliiglaciecola litoralis]|uniref:Sugar fermentation stimulation protein homolog n=1 Tax=Aliiglaciecola litoralis TaxID=582857 RepID=A0ABP3WR30_9ALTE